MPTYEFGDQDNKQFILLEPGEYEYEVTGVAPGVQQNGVTRGSDFIDLELTVNGPEGKATVFERLIFHPKCAWKADCFVKSANLLVDGKVPVKGQEIEFSSATLLGLRGVAVISQEELPLRNPGDTPKRVNRVKTFLTDKPKLLRNFPVQEDAFVDPETGENLPF